MDLTFGAGTAKVATAIHKYGFSRARTRADRRVFPAPQPALDYAQIHRLGDDLIVRRQLGCGWEALEHLGESARAAFERRAAWKRGCGTEGHASRALERRGRDDRDRAGGCA